MTQDSTNEGLQQQIDALTLRVDMGDAEREKLSGRADASDRRADVNDSRSDAIEAQAVLDRELIEGLQADGVLSQQHARDMEAALRSSRTIGAALGIVMHSRDVTEEEAFQILKQASQDSNRKLRDLAADLVRSQSLAHPAD